MHSLVGTLSLLVGLTACTQLSSGDTVSGVAGTKTEQQEQETGAQQEQYDNWFQSLTPEQRANEILKQHERALMP